MFATPSYGKSAMPRDDAARIRDIVEACDRIVAVTKGLSRESFAENDLALRAVLDASP